ncbi:MAG: type II secretion system F family protein, partial [Candidatus Paceibacterota bacterium]
ATKVVIALGNFVATKWYFALAIVAVLAVSSITFLKTATGKRLADSFLVKAPLISPIIKDINSAYTVRNLSSLAAAGVPLPRSLEITAGTVGNGLYKKALLAAADKVRKGEKLSEVLKNYSNIYPQTIIQMIAVGEETGETSAILAKLADFFEDAVSEATKNITSIIEPVMMVIIGGVVGFFAVSIMQPIQDIMTTIK